ncbi:hypothetical protein T02_10954 [Trichinella nativa]|uniref:Uncharacterized protein n=1 Tax=Trichinella nativa TaxID=6335 RepID=A0A0V1LNF5_9BILA|nr:hypothetical protein T02_10954 [Trichinella nativa]
MLQPEKDEKESSQQSTKRNGKMFQKKKAHTYTYSVSFFLFFLELAKEEKSKKNERKRTDPVDEQKSSDSRSIQHNINGLGETSNEFTGKSSREMGVHVEREKRRYTIERCALKCKPKATLVLEINA